MRILACLIDDNKVFQIVTKRMLEKFPDKISDILQFYNGKDALDFFIKNKSNNDQLPDLVFWISICRSWMDGVFWMNFKK